MGRRTPPAKRTGVPAMNLKPLELDANGMPVKKKRGRPPGIKNRDRAVIVAEKRSKLNLRRTRKIKKVVVA